VSNLQITRHNGATHWRIGISDPDAANAYLLREVLAVGGVQVLEYGPEAYELEDVFMQIVGT